MKAGDGAHAQGCGMRGIDKNGEGVREGEDGGEWIFRRVIVDWKSILGYAGKIMSGFLAPVREALI